MSDSSHQRWLIYGLGGGMGHLTRTLALIRAADRLHVSCTLLTNSGFASRLFRPRDVVQPYKHDVQTSEFVSATHSLARRACIANASFTFGQSQEDATDSRHRIVSIAADAGREQTTKLVREHIHGAFPTCRPALMPDRESVPHDCGIEHPYDRVIVDTFPRGLAGELADLLPQVPVPKVLIHRWLNPEYAGRFELQNFIAAYDGLLHPGETGGLSHPRNNLHTGPWLLCDAANMRTASPAREQLRPLVISAGSPADDSRALVLVTGCGRSEEVADSSVLAQWLAVELQDVADVAHSSPGDIWPLLLLLRGVDLLIGAGGYNTVAEARATGTPLLAFAQPRLYDSQQTRLRPEECVRNRDDLLHRARALLSSIQDHRPLRPAGFDNGTHAAAAFVRRLV